MLGLISSCSVKGVLYEQYLEAPARARSTFYTDPIHANQEGHDLIADVLISYIMSQTCAGWAALQGYSYDVPALGSEADGTSTAPSLLGGVGLRKGMPGQSPGDGESASSALSDRYQGLRVPPMRMADRPHDMQSFREIEPFCVAASDLINPLPPSLFYGSGWHTYHPPKNAIVEDRHYWYVECGCTVILPDVSVGMPNNRRRDCGSHFDWARGTLACISSNHRLTSRWAW